MCWFKREKCALKNIAFIGIVENIYQYTERYHAIDFENNRHNCSTIKIITGIVLSFHIIKRNKNVNQFIKLAFNWSTIWSLTEALKHNTFF